MIDTPAPAEALSREQLEALSGYAPGPWEIGWGVLCGLPRDFDSPSARLAAAAPSLHVTALAALARAEEAEAREAEALAAINAAIQCETDLLDMYQRRTSLTTLDLAVADLKRDSLPKLKAARAALAGSPS